MSETKHPWCSDPSRDEAIRAAEDDAAQWRRLEVGEVIEAGDQFNCKEKGWVETMCEGDMVTKGSEYYRRRRVPLPYHRDLPAAVAELRERVGRLEAFTKSCICRETEVAVCAVNPTADASAGDGDGLRTATAIDPGPGWRLLADDEVIEEGDEWLTAPAYLSVWKKTGYRGGGATPRKVGETYRRRVEAKGAQPAPVPPADGLRTERVTLEVTWNPDGEPLSRLADWFPAACLGEWFGAPGESVRVVEESVEVAYDQAFIDRLTAERDAALRHIAATEQSRRDALRERDAAKKECERLRESARGEIMDNVRLRQQTHELRARVRELESAAAAPAANAGGEAKPVLWGVVWGHKDLPEDVDTRNTEEEALNLAKSDHNNGTVVPLYAAPQPPRGWLTRHERWRLGEMLAWLKSRAAAHPNTIHGALCESYAADIDAILARKTPSRVRTPVGSLKRDETVAGYLNERDSQWIAAIREAGGEVE